MVQRFTFGLGRIDLVATGFGRFGKCPPCSVYLLHPHGDRDDLANRLID
jgi:hypothetical protein